MAWSDYNKPQLTVLPVSVTLTIPFKDKWPKTVQAKQVGDLAVINYDEDFDWCIVHVPTLTRFDKAIPDGDWTEEQLLLWAYKVQQDRRDCWDILHNLNNDNYNIIGLTVL